MSNRKQSASPKVVHLNPQQHVSLVLVSDLSFGVIKVHNLSAFSPFHLSVKSVLLAVPSEGWRHQLS